MTRKRGSGGQGRNIYKRERSNRKLIKKMNMTSREDWRGKGGEHLGNDTRCQYRCMKVRQQCLCWTGQRVLSVRVEDRKVK